MKWLTVETPHRWSGMWRKMNCRCGWRTWILRPHRVFWKQWKNAWIMGFLVIPWFRNNGMRHMLAGGKKDIILKWKRIGLFSVQVWCLPFLPLSENWQRRQKKCWFRHRCTTSFSIQFSTTDVRCWKVRLCWKMEITGWILKIWSKNWRILRQPLWFSVTLIIRGARYGTVRRSQESASCVKNIMWLLCPMKFIVI